MDETTVQPEYKPAQLRADLHEDLRILAFRRKTQIREEIAVAVERYLAQEAATIAQTAQRPAVAP